MLAHLVALAAPPRCAACHAPLADPAQPLCGACRRGLPWLGDRLCPRCALPAAGAHTCPARRQAFTAAWAAVAYAGVGRDVVAALKFAGARPLVAVMAAHLAAGAPARLLDGVTLVAVPGHPARRRARGFDPAALLARELSRRAGLPLSAGVLRRRSRSGRQLGASRSARLAAGRLDVAATRPAPAHAVLVDDVHTTGATLDACACALRAVGAREVVAITWARTLPR